ncbi:MAG: methyltransferase domain-containing protein, partial [Dehalococcoidia bacterium]|nr:methyltransferase domain-containing protein [Dehalococcoidia bacterium]
EEKGQGMAASSAGRLAMQLQKYFDQLAPTWDKELTRERLKRLGNIVKELGIKPGYYVLDIGSGTGVLLSFLTAEVGDEGKIVALDFSAEMLVQAQAKNFPPMVGLAQADVLAIPLADSSMDLAICNSAFPHFGDKVKALKEIARVLKNNGRLAICHTMSREMLNRLHQSIGGIIASDLLPDEFQLRGLIKQAGLKITRFEDKPQQYLVVADKSTR